MPTAGFFTCECGASVSRLAQSCPRCGKPVSADDLGAVEYNDDLVPTERLTTSRPHVPKHLKKPSIRHGRRRPGFNISLSAFGSHQSLLDLQHSQR